MFVTVGLALLQAVLCFTAGLATLLRSRTVAKWSLIVAGLCWLGYPVTLLMRNRFPKITELRLPLTLLLEALLLLFPLQESLASSQGSPRWLGAVALGLLRYHLPVPSFHAT
nr:hypothetical protein [Armatimonas sp.]